MPDINAMIKDLGDGLFFFGDQLICAEPAIACEAYYDIDIAQLVVSKEYSRYYLRFSYTQEITEDGVKWIMHWKREYKDKKSEESS